MTAAKARSTRQRRAIEDSIAQAQRPLSPREILDAACSRVRGVGLATVYRTLRLLIAEAKVQSVDIPGEPPRFEPVKGHHHHFSCRSCGRVFDLGACCGHFEELTPPGFCLEDHELVLFGCCRDCVPCAGASTRRSSGKPRSTRRS